MGVAAAAMLVAYAAWAFRRPERGPWYEATIVPVMLWLGRYRQLVARGHGEAPEELILRDRPLLVLSLLWTALFLASTIATSATGFLFHSKTFGPPHVVGVISLMVLAIGLLALYGLHLARNWRGTYVFCALAALYFNVFVAVAQAFERVVV